MSAIGSTISETRRLVHEYWTAAVREANHPFAVVSSLYRILCARSKHGVGPLYYSLYQFSKLPRHQWGDYLTDTPDFKQLLREMSPPSMQRMAHNKALLYQHCVAQDLPTIPIFCMVGRSPDPLAPSLPIVSNLDEWLNAMREASGDLFVKSVDGTYGIGSFGIHHTGRDAYEFEGNTGSLSDVYHHIVRRKLELGQGWLVQPRVAVHPELKGVVPRHGLATVRVVTSQYNGDARLIVACFKVTVGGNDTDNFSKGKSGNLLAGVDIASGKLTAGWGSRDKVWPRMESFRAHPDTGERIEGHRLPLWNEVIDTCIRAQQSLPLLASAGWDVAITDRGVMIVEANLTYDISILQIAHQRGLKAQILGALRKPASSPA